MDYQPPTATQRARARQLGVEVTAGMSKDHLRELLTRAEKPTHDQILAAKVLGVKWEDASLTVLRHRIDVEMKRRRTLSDESVNFRVGGRIEFESEEWIIDSFILSHSGWVVCVYPHVGGRMQRFALSRIAQALA